MNKRIKKLWIKALRSGFYRQGEGQLKRGRGASAAYCCLGVLSDIAVKQGAISRFSGVEANLPRKVQAWAEVNASDPVIGDQCACRLNDRGASFTEIADRIEKYL